jgi:hypothetical protein
MTQANDEDAMRVRNVTPILNVSNIVESIAWFERVGWRRGFTWPKGDPDPGFGSVCSGWRLDVLVAGLAGRG